MSAPSLAPDQDRRIRALEDALYNLQRERILPGSTLDNCPTGAVMGFLVSTPPTGWVLLDGSVVSATTHPALHAFLLSKGLSTTLPDYRDRFLVGAGNLYSGTSTGGSANAVVVSHTHTGPDHVHAQNVSAAVGGSGVRSDYDADAASSSFPQGINTGSAGTGNTGSTGSSGANANLPPYRGIYWMIRA